MNYFIIICFLIVSTGGCAPEFKSRYDSITKQDSYVSVKFGLDENKYLNKTRPEIKELMGEPANVLKKNAQGNPQETWIYYPEATNNFIAVIISFEGDKVKSAAYQSVM